MCQHIVNTDGKKHCLKDLLCHVMAGQGSAEVALQFDSLHSIALGFRLVQTGGHCHGN